MNEKKRRGNPDKTKPFRWKKGGPSPNPGGRPKRSPGTDALRELLTKPCPRDRDGRTYAEVIAAALIKSASRGDVRAFKEILDRVEGKVANRVEVTGADGEVIRASVDAKLSADDLLGALRLIYGLEPRAGKQSEAETDVSAR